MHTQLVNHAANLIARLAKFELPADRVVGEYFREHRIGQNDRGVLAQTVFYWLRHKPSIDFVSASGPASRPRRAALLAWQGPALMLNAKETQWLSLARQETIPASCLHGLPDWLATLLQTQYQQDFEPLAAALLQPASLHLRVNTLKTNQQELLRELARQGIQASPAQFAPTGIYVEGHPALERLDAFADGWFEVQDEGSQLLASLVAAKRGEMVLDFCAGAGGKTLALAAQMNNSGRLYAFDISPARLDKLKQRLARAGVDNVYRSAITSENDPRVKRLAGKLDRVLIDAPCSGTGTIRRNPDLKWRLDAATIERLTQTQTSILQSAARLPKVGGRLVYATCSLLEQENQLIQEQFLRNQPNFRLVETSQFPKPIQSLVNRGKLELLPGQYAGDGFFAFAVQRVC